VYGAGLHLADTVKLALAVEYTCDLELLVAGRVPAAALDGFDDPRVRVIRAGDDGNDPVRAAAAEATGDYLVTLDPELRYDPQDIPRLLEPIQAGHTTVVYGSRRFGSHSGNSFWYVLGNKALTTAANIIFNCYLSDLETGYKLMPVAVYRSLPKHPRGPVADAAVTGSLLRRGVRPFEVPVSYNGGGWAAGGVGLVAARALPAMPRPRRIRALLVLMRERLRRPI
jgi:hypothetical protein